MVHSTVFLRCDLALHLRSFTGLKTTSLKLSQKYCGAILQLLDGLWQG